MKQIFKRVMAGVLSVAVAVSGLQITAPTETDAAVITAFSTDNIPVSSFRWEFAEKFTKDAVYKNDALNPEMVTYGNFINEAGAESYIAGRTNATVQAAAETSVVTGLSGTVPSDKPWVLYHDVGLVEKSGEVVRLDVKVTLTGWEVADGTAKSDAFVQFGTCADASSADEDYPHDTQAIGIWPSANVKYIDLQYEFYRAGTAQKYDIDGSFSLVDLDYTQYFQLDGSSNVSSVAKAANESAVRGWYDGAEHITMSVSGSTTTIQSSDAGTSPTNDVTIGSETKPVDKSYEAGYVTFRFSDQDTVRFRFGSKAVADTVNSTSLNHYYYGILPYSIGSYEAPQPEKYVVQPDGTLTADYTLNAGSRKVTYAEYVFIPRSLSTEANYNYYSLTDTLNDVYDMSKTSVKVYRDAVDGTDVTGWFTVSTSGQSVTVTAKQGVRDVVVTKADGTSETQRETGIIDSSSHEFFGHSYYFVIETQIRDSVTVRELAKTSNQTKWGVYPEDDLYVIPNTCSNTAGVYNAYTGIYTNTPKDSNETRVRFTEPVLKITKQVATSADAAKGVWSTETTAEYNDTVKYRITVTQTTPGAVLTGLKVADTSLQNNKHLQAGAAAGTLTYNGTGKPVPVTLDGNAVTLGSFTSLVTGKTNELGYGEELTVTFDALVKRAGDVTNTAVADADNGLHGEAKATVTAKKPELKIEKYEEKASGSEGVNYEAGDVASYKVVVLNDGSDSCAARNVVLDDAWTGAASMRLSAAAAPYGIEVYHTTDYGNYTDTSSAVKLVNGTDYAVSSTDTSGGYRVTFKGGYADLKSCEAYIITYKTTVTGGSAGDEITNCATASASNSEDVRDEQTIRIRNSSVETDAAITKKVSAAESPMGDTVTYTVTATNTGDDAISGLVITDDSLPEGFTLQDIRLEWYVDRLGSGGSKWQDWSGAFDGGIAWPVTGRGAQGWIGTTGDGENGNGWHVEQEYDTVLGVGESLRITATYVTDRNAPTDGSVINTARLSGTGAETGDGLERTASAETRIIKPVLKVTKSADRTLCEEGDIISYTITVEQDPAQERTDMTACSVIVNDSITGASIRNRTSKTGYTVVKVDKNGSETEVTDYSLSQKGWVINGSSLGTSSVVESSSYTVSKGTGTGISTGQDLAYGEKLIITCSAKASEGALSVTNTAKAEATNADEASGSAVTKVHAPALSVTKQADRRTYGYGDTVKYTVTVTQTEPATAKNAELLDYFDDGLVQLLKGGSAYVHDVVVYDGDGNRLVSREELLANPELYPGLEEYDYDYAWVVEEVITDEGDILGEGLHVYFGDHTEYKNMGEYDSFTLTYEVDLIDAHIEDTLQADGTMPLTNTVLAWADNVETVTADETVTVARPELSVTKSADKQQYAPGGKVSYTVEVWNKTSGVTVKGLAVRDAVPAGMTLDTASVRAVLVDSEGNETGDGSISISTSGNNWRVERDELAYGSTVRVYFTATAPGTAGTVTNTAYASADNADEVSDDAKILIHAKYSITVTKKLLADDINFANGDPIFVMNVSGTNDRGEEVSLHRILRFTEAYVTLNTDAEGYVGMEAVFAGLRPGVYTASEADDTLRYRFERLEDVPAFAVISKTAEAPETEPSTLSVTFDTSEAEPETELGVTFVNVQYEAQYDSHTDSVENRFNTAAEGNADE